MKNPIRIHDALKQAEFAANVELIDVPVEGAAIALLRTKEMPEFAFVMWVDVKTSTLSQMVFFMHDHGTSAHYPVVCACCSSERYGLKSPTEDKEGEVAWETVLAAKFKAALAGACRANGVTTIFMRHANSWRKHYGDAEGLIVVEALWHRDAFLNLYGRKVVRDALQFIDYSSSKGLIGERDPL
ncbi:MAG: hypothetical protein Q8P78_03050 [bacterium]|nr:hypothetical protein [bacterium]